MAEQFDPYYQWLGIPQDERPINKYRLLSLQLFESDEDVIANAADRQMAFIRTFQSGVHSAESQMLLNELSSARVTLLNKESKAEYDQQLRQTLGARELRSTAPPVPPAPGQALPVPPLDPSVSNSPSVVPPAPPASNSPSAIPPVPPTPGQTTPSAAPPAPPVFQPPVQKLANWGITTKEKSKEKKKSPGLFRFLLKFCIFILALFVAVILFFAITGIPVPISTNNETLTKIMSYLHIKCANETVVTPDTEESKP